jgi:phage terminase large subunit GpA-like protein
MLDRPEAMNDIPRLLVFGPAIQLLSILTNHPTNVNDQHHLDAGLVCPRCDGDLGMPEVDTSNSETVWWTDGLWMAEGMRQAGEVEIAQRVSWSSHPSGCVQACCC